MTERLTRRRFIGTGAAAGAGALLGGPAAALAGRGSLGSRTVDVAVVGAGFAGLTAARRLRKAGLTVAVVEARNRVGGRALNRSIGGGEESERGATFVGPTQDHIIRLARSVGVDTFPTYNTGENVYYADGERLTFSDDSPLGSAPPDPLVIGDLVTAVLRLDELSKAVPVDAPWEAGAAREYDGKTLQRFIEESSPNPRFQRLVATATRPIFGAEPRELSLLFVLFYIAASGDERNIGTFERNFNTRDGAQMFRFEGGSQLICERIARSLGSRVVLGSPVRRVVQRNGRVVVESDRVTVRAERAILALPPALDRYIDFAPGLPTSRAQLGRRLPQGRLIKCTAVYDTPFWRERGLTGQALSLNGPVSATFDDSPPDGRPGVVFGFVGGDDARRFLNTSRSTRRGQVLENFATFFGSEARRPREYFETNWVGDPWARGCPVGIAPPGTYTAFGTALRQPVGRLHWASTETSNYWNGYMDGAVRSGERAAIEVIDAL